MTPTNDTLDRALAELDAAKGRLSLVGGRLRVDVDQELPEWVWQTLADHQSDLTLTLAGDRPILWSEDEPIWSGPTKPLPLPAGVDCCDRCRGISVRDVPIHGGRSVRQDCATCGRFRRFSTWYGVEMP